MEDNCVKIWGGPLLGESVVVWDSRAARLAPASLSSQAGLPNCCQAWGHWLRRRAELRGWLKGFSAGQWARPGKASYWAERPYFRTAVFISQGPCIYHGSVLRLFPLINCSYCFCFYDHPGMWLSWWPDIFTRLWALQRALIVMGCDVQNWVLEPPRVPASTLLLAFFPSCSFFNLIPQVT